MFYTLLEHKKGRSAIKMKNNKTWIAVLVSSIIIAAFGLGFQQIFADPQNDPLSTQEITELINERYPGEIESIELDYQQGVMVYYATVITDKGSYHITLDAKTGTVLKVAPYGNIQEGDDTKRYSLTEDDDDTSEKKEHNQQSSAINTEKDETVEKKCRNYLIWKFFKI